jgi:hypothetical protein
VIPGVSNANNKGDDLNSNSRNADIKDASRVDSAESVDTGKAAKTR